MMFIMIPINAKTAIIITGVRQNDLLVFIWSLKLQNYRKKKIKKSKDSTLEVP